MSFTIMVDCDNVICNLQEVVVELFNQRYGTSYTLEDFTKYGVEECIPEDDAKKMQAMYAEPGIYDNVKPLPGAQKVLQKFIDYGFQVYIVTDAVADTYGEKVAWIKRYFSFIDDAHIVCMKHKWLFKCEVMIEDKWENLVAGHHYERVCMNFPWNQSTKDDIYGIYRCNKWDEILDVVTEIRTCDK